MISAACHALERRQARLISRTPGARSLRVGSRSTWFCVPVTRKRRQRELADARRRQDPPSVACHGCARPRHDDRGGKLREAGSRKFGDSPRNTRFASQPISKKMVSCTMTLLPTPPPYRGRHAGLLVRPSLSPSPLLSSPSPPTHTFSVLPSLGLCLGARGYIAVGGYTSSST